MIIVGENTHRGRACRVGCRVRRSRRPHRQQPRTRVTSEGGRVFFSSRTPQQMERPRLMDWLAGVAMLLAAASWGILASLLGS